MGKHCSYKEIIVLKKQKLPLCKCGCKKRVKKKGNKYIVGHNYIFRDLKVQQKRIKALQQKTSGEKHWKWIEKEIRKCACRCKKEFKCKITSKQKFIWGHNMCTSTARKRKRKQIKLQRKNPKFAKAQKKSGEKRRGINHHAWIPLEIRICICGCKQSFECKANSKRKYFAGKCWMKNRHVSIKTRRKISKSQKGKPRPLSVCGKNHYGYGKHLLEKTKRKIRKSLSEYRKNHPKENIKNTRNMIEYNRKYREYKKGESHPGWKGGCIVSEGRARKKAQKRVRNFADSYIKGILTEGTILTPADIPSELIKTKREQLKVYRLIKKGT